MKTITSRSILTGLFLMLLCGTAFAQQMPPVQPAPLDTVTAEQFDKFVEINKAFESLGLETQEEIIGLLEGTPITFERFQQIVQQMQNPQMAGQLNLSEEEQSTLTELQPQIQQISMNAQQEQVKIIQDNGMTTQVFQQVGQFISTSPELLEKFRTQMEMNQPSDG